MSIRGLHTWEGSCAARWPYILLVIALVAATVLGAAGLPVAAVLVLAATFPLILLTRIGVQAGPDGVRIEYGPMKWPVQTITLDDIETASAMNLSPLRWGGWGYRGSLKIFKKAAVTLRKGPALRLDLTRGRLLLITIDEPALAANVLNQAIVMRPPAADSDE